MSNEEKSVLEELLRVMSDRISNLTEWVEVLGNRITTANKRINLLVETNKEK